MNTYKLSLLLPIFLGSALLSLNGCSVANNGASQNASKLAETVKPSNAINSTVGQCGAKVAAMTLKPEVATTLDETTTLAFANLYGDNPNFKKYGVTFANLHDRLLILIPVSSLFAPTSDIFNKTALDVLTPITKFLTKYQNTNVHISGNSDPILDKKYAFSRATLSEQRAVKVAGYFWTHGMNRHSDYQRRLTYSGNGVIYPIATNQELSGMMVNRRVEISIYSRGISPFSDKKLSNKVRSYKF
jgi:flagellar motor protein MotB